ncbi:MAG: queuosine precursor transporter, partial [Bacilli bacterium]|nr:queuosine precursor transporter [Bacilli bacterium]
MNELYWVITLIISFVGVLLFYKFFGKTGLFIWLVLATIISNIQTVKLVYLFGVETSLGNILYGTTFLATDILNEKYGKEVARKSIFYCFSSMVAMTVLMCLSLIYIPSANDFA